MYGNSNSPTFGNLHLINSTDEDHEEFTERLRKTLYYGKLPGTDRPSMPLTDMAVEFFQEAAPRKLGRLDTYFASSASRSACMTPTSVVAGMMYVKRLRKRQPEYLTQISSSELFLISMMMASKFLYDEGVDEEVFNDEWATSADMDVEDVNELERDFLAAIDWQLFVRPDEFSEMLNTVEKRIALSQGLHRGWFSYTDLCVLSQDLKFMTWNDLSMELSKVLSVSSLAYLASILTMIGSTVLGTAASTALVSAGGSLLPVYRSLPLVTPILPHSELGSASLEEISALDISNSSKPGFDIPRLLTDENLVQSSESTNTVSESQENEESQNGQESRNEQIFDPVSTEQGTFINGFLSPFLALVTLKDTLVKFAYAVAEKNKVDMETDSENTDEIQNICSDGPCLVDSWTNCWNVSSEFDWTEFKTFHADCSHTKDRHSNYDSFYQPSFNEFSQLGRCHAREKSGTYESKTDRYRGVHCCCKWPSNSVHLDFISMNSQLPDLTYGFITSSILITA